MNCVHEFKYNRAGQVFCELCDKVWFDVVEHERIVTELTKSEGDGPSYKLWYAQGKNDALRRVRDVAFRCCEAGPYGRFALPKTVKEILTELGIEVKEE